MTRNALALLLGGLSLAGCATTPIRLDASRNGSTPMSTSRVTALTASLVCSVANTR